MEELIVVYPLSRNIKCPYATILAFLFQHYYNNKPIANVDEMLQSATLQSAMSAVQSINLNSELTNILGDPRDGENPFYTLSRLAEVSSIDETFKKLISLMEVDVVVVVEYCDEFDLRTITKLQSKGIITRIVES